MKNFYYLLFFLTMILGTLITISSYSWFSMWMGLEINLLSIIPLLKDKNNLYASEAALKYFITQALASTILLFSIILSFNLENYINNSPPINMILNSALFIKMGAAPFHAWFPEVLEGLNWNNSMIMLTWQKIAPMIIVLYDSHLSNLMFSIIIISSIFSGILGLNQISLRKILAYSSINHISWMLASMINTQSIFSFYFLIYTTISLNLILMFNYLKIFLIPQLFNSLIFDKNFKFFFILNFLSLGGLPPFLGFYPKWLVINSLVSSKFYLLGTLLIISTLITLFFYLRIVTSAFLLNSNESLIYAPKKMSSLILIFNFISLIGLVICTIFWNFN